MANPFLEDYLNELIEEEERKLSWGGNSPASIPLVPMEQAQPEKNIAWDIVGSSLWSFADEAAFGGLSLGAYALDVDTEGFRPESFAAKMGSSVGALAGFAVGAPMKVGGKILTTAARPFLKKALAEAGEDIVVESAKKYSKQVSKEAAELAIKKDITKGFTQQFLNTSAQASFNKGLAKNFKEKMVNGIDDLAKSYVDGGKMSLEEAQIATRLFKDKFTRRPIQNFKDLWIERGNNPWVGNLLDEAIMFGAIDAIREVPMAISQEREYDWMMPIWGLGVGLGFGGMKFLSPAGKGSNFRLDLVDGIKATFGKNIYRNSKKSTDDLKRHSQWLYGQMKDNGDEALKSTRKVKIGDREYQFDLSLPDQAINEYGERVGRKVLEEGLDQYSKEYGKELLNWAIKEEWGTLSENFFRMVGGGMLMSAHSLYEIHRNDVELTAEDILPGVLIGAWMTRRGEFRAWDLNKRANRVRKNLTVLGHDARNLVDIPTFSPYMNPHLNPIEQNNVMRQARDVAAQEDIQIITDSYEQSVAQLSADTQSVLAAHQTTGEYDIFMAFHKLLGGQRKFIKETDNISVKDADAIQNILKEAKWDVLNNKSIESPNDLAAVIDNVMEASSGVFERNLATTLFNMKNALNIPDELKIDMEDMGSFPELLWAPREADAVTGDPSLYQYANNGDLIPGVSGPDSGKIIDDIIRKSNQIIKTLASANRISLKKVSAKGEKYGGVKDREAFIKLKEIVDTFESRIRESLGVAEDKEFSIFDYMDDMESLMVFNNAKRSAKSISNLFGWGMPGHDELHMMLRGTGLLHGEIGQSGKAVLNVGDNSIKIIGADDAEIADAKRFLNSTLSIINAKGQYGRGTPESAIEVDIAEVNALKDYLGKRGMHTGLMQMDKYNNYTIDFIERETIAGTNLTMNDMHTIHRIQGMENYGLINYSTTTGRGFEIRKINEMPAGDDANFAIKRYNQFVDNIKLKGRSETGDLFQDQDAITITNKDAIDEINRMLDYSDSDAFVASKQALTDFVNSVRSKHPAFVNQMIQFAESNKDYSDFLLKWLSDSNIIERKASDSYIKYSYNEKGLEGKNGENVIALLKANMNEYGVSYDRIEAQYNQNREAVLDMISEGYSYTHKDLSMTQDQFFNKYFVDDNGAPQYDMEMQNQLLDNIISINKARTQGVDLGLVDIKDMKLEVGTSKDLKPILGLDGLLKNDTFKYNIDGKYKTFDELDLNNDIHKNAFDEAMDGLTSLLMSKLNSVEVPMYIWDGKSNYRTTVMQRGNLHDAFDEWGLSLSFISGSGENFVNLGSKVERRRFSLFEGNSKYLSKDDRALVDDQLKTFEDDLNGLRVIVKNRFREGLEPETVQIDDGISIFRISNGFQPMGVLNNELPQIAKAYRKLSEKVSDSLPDHLQKDMRETLEEMEANPTVKMAAHEKALRQLLFEKISTEGSDVSLFTELLINDRNNNGDLDKISKRFSLYHTPNFKRIKNSAQELAARGTARSKEDQDILNKFFDRGTVKMAIWDDKQNASIKRNLKRALGKDKAKEFWDNELHGRSDETPFDSITYMSKEQMRFWSLSMGRAANNETQLFKPAISSTGDVLLLGKTVFVYDPFLDNFFKDNDIDLLTTKSASKVMGNGWDMIQGDEAAIGLFKGAGKHAREIKISDIGIKQDRIHTEDIAKISQSTWNYLSSSEAAMIFDQFYSDQLGKALENMDDLYRNAEKRRMFFDEGLFQDQSVNSMFEGTAGGANLGAAKFGASIGMDPIEFGENMMASAMYRKLIDPVVNQSAKIGGERFGGKSVLIQSLNPILRDLRPTIVKNGKIEQYGQIMLPGHEMRQTLGALKGKGMTIKSINTETNEILNVKDMEFVSSKTKKKYKMDDDELVTMTLGDLHSRVNESTNGKFEIAIITNRYPRTRPNDLSIQGLKGFLNDDFGNSMIVNELDVLNIFEGDYDVDKNDYFFMHSNDAFKHIQASVPIWSQGIDVDRFATEGSSLKLAGNATDLNSEWAAQQANGSVLKKGIGVVQKMHRGLNWLRDLADVQDITGKGLEKGQKQHVLLQLQDGSKVVMDYNNTDWWHRAVLETQAIIDAGTGVDGSLMRYMREWKDDFLFPTIDDSELADNINEGNRIGFLRDVRNRTEGTKRVRLFKKFDKEGKPADLGDIDKAIIRTMLNEYSNFIALGTNLFERTGHTKKPSYSDIIDRSDEYFRFMNNDGKGGNIARRVFFKLPNRLKDTDDISNYFGSLKDKLKARSRNKDPKDLTRDDYYFENGSLNGPFPSGLIDRSGQVGKGKYGNIFDRSMHMILDADPMKAKSHKGFSVQMMEEMDEAFNRFIENPDYRDGFNADVMSFVTDVNKGISSIKYLKRQFGFISRSNKSYKQKQQLMDSLNEQIAKIENRLWEILPEKYKKSHKSKDLNDGYIKVLDLNSNKELVDGTVQLYAMNAMAKINEGPTQMHRDISDLQALERRFFGDMQDLSATLRYGESTATSQRIKEYLKGMPSNYNDIEAVIDFMIEQNFKKYGPSFMYHYALPTKHKNAIGIFNGQSVVVPYSPNGRMRRILKWMAKRADKDNDIKQQMKIMAPMLKHYRSYFEKDFKYMSNDLVIDPNIVVPGSDVGLTYEHLQFPDFNKSFQTAFDSFRSFKWEKQADTVDFFKAGPDPVINFYTKFFNLFEQGDAFKEYMKQHSSLMNTMQSTQLVDPMRYLAMVSNMDADIHKFVGQRFTGYITEGKNGPVTIPVDNVNLKSLEGDPIFALLGGPNHFKGLTLNPGKKHTKASFESMIDYSRQANTIVKGRPSEGNMKNILDIAKQCSVRGPK